MFQVCCILKNEFFYLIFIYKIIAKHGASIKNTFAIKGSSGKKYMLHTLSLFNDNSNNNKFDNSLYGSLIEDIETGPLLRYELIFYYLLHFY